MYNKGNIPKVDELLDIPIVKITSKAPVVKKGNDSYFEFEFKDKITSLQRKELDNFYTKVGSWRPFRYVYDNKLYIVKFNNVTRITHADKDILTSSVSWVLKGLPDKHARMTEFLREHLDVFTESERKFLSTWHSQECFPLDARLNQTFIDMIIGADHNTYKQYLQNSGLSQHHHLRVVKYSYYYAGMAYNQNSIHIGTSNYN